jgi:hypothetical protein
MQDRAGIGPGPYTNDNPEWPTYGYDGSLCGWEPPPRVRVDGYSGCTRAEWQAIADEMLARWTEWRAWMNAAPAHLFAPEDAP